MNPEVEAIYARFDALGVAEVRKQLASHVYGEDRTRHAEAWLRLKDHEEEADSREAVIASAREANALAREANDLASAANKTAEDAAASARLSAAAAKTNNTIATIALIAAVIAMAISIIGIFVK